MTNDNIHEDFMFGSLTFLMAKPHLGEIEEFKRLSTSSNLPDEYTFESLEAIIKINRIKMEFRILKRKYYSKENIMRGYPSNIDVDLSILMAYKIAKESGFKVFLEPKYMN